MNPRFVICDPSPFGFWLDRSFHGRIRTGWYIDIYKDRLVLECFQGWIGYKECRELFGVPSRVHQRALYRDPVRRTQFVEARYVWNLSADLYAHLLQSKSLLASEVYACLPPLDIVDILGE